MTTKEYETGYEVAGDYIKAFLRDVKNLGMKRISYYKGLEGLANFKDYYAKRENLNEGQIIQGENELNLAIEIYNQTTGKENLN